MPRGERRQARRALAWLVLADVLLATTSYRTARAWLARLSRPGSRTRNISNEDCARAVARAHVVLPRARCLALALAADCLLRRSGRAAKVVLGVGFGEDRAFEAHAWLECDGAIIVGAAEAARYTPLPS